MNNFLTLERISEMLNYMYLVEEEGAYSTLENKLDTVWKFLKEILEAEQKERDIIARAKAEPAILPF